MSTLSPKHICTLVLVRKVFCPGVFGRRRMLLLAGNSSTSLSILVPMDRFECSPRIAVVSWTDCRKASASRSTVCERAIVPSPNWRCKRGKARPGGIRNICAIYSTYDEFVTIADYHRNRIRRVHSQSQPCHHSPGPLPKTATTLTRVPCTRLRKGFDY